MGHLLWRNRWLRAGAVAVLLCAWPACVQHEDEDEIPSAGKPSLDFVLKDIYPKDFDALEKIGHGIAGSPITVRSYLENLQSEMETSSHLISPFHVHSPVLTDAVFTSGFRCGTLAGSYGSECT